MDAIPHGSDRVFLVSLAMVHLQQPFNLVSDRHPVYLLGDSLFIIILLEYSRNTACHRYHAPCLFQSHSASSLPTLSSVPVVVGKTPTFAQGMHAPSQKTTNKRHGHFRACPSSHRTAVLPTRTQHPPNSPGIRIFFLSLPSLPLIALTASVVLKLILSLGRHPSSPPPCPLGV